MSLRTLLAIALCPGLLLPLPVAEAYFSDNANAINMLGQYDETSLTAPIPEFTKSTANNASNRLGISSPTLGIYLDTTDHRFFLADSSNNRILIYNLDANNNFPDRIPDNVLGQTSFFNRTATISQSGLQNVNALTYDPANKRLFASQLTTERVVAFDLANGITDGMNASHVLGQTTYTSQTGTNTQAGLNDPEGIYYDPATKYLYVAQSAANRVSVFDLSSGIGNGSPAMDQLGAYDDVNLSAPAPVYTKSTANNGLSRLGLATPTAIAVDAVNHHRLFVTDNNGGRVLVYNLDSNNNLVDRIPDNVLGQTTFYNSIGSITQSGWQGPKGLAYDSVRDRLFVAEASNNRVTVFSTATISNGMNATNVLGQTTFSTNTPAVTQAGMSSPQYLAYDSENDRLFVSQSGGNRVTVYDVASITNGESAIGVLGQTTFTGTSAASTQAGMNAPSGLAYDPTNNYLFVAQNTGNRVTVFNLSDGITDGENAINVLGQTSFTAAVAGNSQTGIAAPLGISYDDTHKRLFIPHSTTHKVTIYDLSSGISNNMNAWHVLGQTNWTNNSAATTQAGVNAPQATAYDTSTDRLYVADSTNHRIKLYDMSGSISDNQNAVDVLGQNDDAWPTPGPVFTKGTVWDGPNQFGFSTPTNGVLLDTVYHRLFIADTGNSRVLVYNLDAGNTLLDRLPDNVLGQTVFYTNTSAVTQAGLTSPNGLAFDSVNNYLFVADTANRVKVYDTASITNGENAINVLGQSTFTGASPATTQAGMNIPYGVFYDSAGQRLFVSQNSGNRVTVYNTGDGISDGENAVNVLGQLNFTATSAATTQAGMNIPHGVTMSGSTTLFVSQGTGGNRVTVYNVGDGITDGENAIKVLGQSTFTATTAATTQAGMNQPRGLAYDSDQKILFVAQSSGGNRVTLYNLGDGITDGENATYVFGQSTFIGANVNNTQAGMSATQGVTYDSANKRLYVLQGNHRMTIYDLTNSFSEGQDAFRILGQSDFTSATAATTQTGMNVPYGVTMSGSTTLFVSQGTGNRVTAYNVGDGITTGENAIKVLGQTTFTATSAATTQAGMNAPRGIVYDATNKRLFVAQSTASRVTVYNLADGITDGENAVNVLGQTTFTGTSQGFTQAGMAAPQGLVYDNGNSRLFVLQNLSHRVTAYNLADGITDGENAVDALGQFDDNLASPGPVYTGSAADNGPNMFGFNAPNGIALDAVNRRLFVADTSNNRVMVYNMSGGNILNDRIPDYVIGQADFHTRTIATTQAGMSGPKGVEYDSINNRLFVTDTGNSRVLVYNTASLASGMNAANVLGKANFITSNAIASQSSLNGPQRTLFVAGNSRLYVTDGGSRVVVYNLSDGITNGENAVDLLGQFDDATPSANPTPVYTKSAANNVPNRTGFSGGNSTYVDTIDHRLFVSEGNQRILVYNLDANNALQDRIADYVLGQSSFLTNSGLDTQTGMRLTAGLAYDTVNKRLFVAESNGNRVKVFDLSNGISTGMNAWHVLGQTNYSGNSAANSQTGMNNPQGIYYDVQTKRLFVAQTGNNRVTVYDFSNGIGNGSAAVNLLGQYDETSMTNPLPQYTKTAAHNASNRMGLSAPKAIAIDTVRHRAFVSDDSNRRILIYNLDSANNFSDRIPDNVLGQTTFYDVSGSISQSRIQAHRGLSYDALNDRLFVAEQSNQRVLVFSTATITDGMNAAFVIGQADFTTGSTATTQAGVSSPQDVLYEPNTQKLFVAQTGNNRVTVYDLSDGISNGENAVNVLGQSDFLSSSAASTQSGLNQPYALAYDSSSHYLFVANQTSNRVTVYDLSDGISNGENAIKVLGQANFTGAGGAVTQAGMFLPSGLDYDQSRRLLFVSESSGNRVKTYDLSGGITDGMNAANVLGQTSFTASVALTTQVNLSSPQDITYDATTSRLYIADNSNNRISIYDVASISNGENAVDVLGQNDDNLSAPAAVFTKGLASDAPNRLGLNAPSMGIVLDTTNHRLFVSDSNNNRVLVYNLDANNTLLDRVPDSVLGQTNFYTNASATTQSGLNFPEGLGFDSATNTLFVAQGNLNRVTVYDTASITNGENATKVLGQTSFTSATTATTQAGMNIPQDAFYDASRQYLFVSQSSGNRVTVYDLSDGITDGENAIKVLGQSTFTTTAAATTQAGMNSPRGVSMSGSTTLLVSQLSGNRVTAYNLEDGITDGENAIKVLGQSTFTGTTAASTQAGLNGPRGLTYDPVRKLLFVTNANGHRVTIYDLTTGITDGMNANYVMGQSDFTSATAGGSQAGMTGPQGVAYDSVNKRLYTLLNNQSRVAVYDLANGFSDGQPASAVLGQSSFTATAAATTQAGLNAPWGITMSGSSTLFVSQSSGNRVTVYNVGDGITDGENAIKVIGQANFTATSAATTQAGLNSPRGMVYDSAGKRLFIANTNRVTVYNLSDGITDGENAVNVLGQTTFTSATSTITQSGLVGPIDLTYDAGNARLSVLQSARLTLFDIGGGITDGMNAVDVVGQTDENQLTPGPSFTTNGTNNGPNSISMSSPTGLAIDTAKHRLFVADTSNNRILVYNLNTDNSLTDRIADSLLGQSDFRTVTANTSQKGFNGPQGLTYDPVGDRLFVSEINNNRVMVFSVGAIQNGESGSSLLGQPTFVSNTQLTSQSAIRSTQAILFDPVASRLYTAENGNHRVMIFDAEIRSITGKIYSDLGVTPIASGKKVAVSLNGGPFAATGVTIEGGQYSVAGTGAGLNLTGGTIVAVYLDNNAERGVTVTVASGSKVDAETMTGVDIYQNTLIARSDSGGIAMTTSKLGTAATNGFADVGSIYTAGNGTVSVQPGKSLVVWSGSTLTPTGPVLIGSGLIIRGTVNAGSQTIALSGAFIKTPSGRFLAGTSTVILNGLLQSLSGSTTFYNLTKTGSTTDTLTFAAGSTQTVTNRLSLNGNPGALLFLRSGRAGTQWNIAPQGVRSVSYVDVKDSQNLHLSAIDCLTGCVDSSNNIRWFFGASDPSRGGFFFLGF